MKRRLFTALALTLAVTTASACEVNHFKWQNSDSGKNVVRLTLDMSGCLDLQQTTIKLYNDGEWIGSTTIYGNTTSVPVDVTHRITKGKVTIHTTTESRASAEMTQRSLDDARKTYDAKLHRQ